MHINNALRDCKSIFIDALISHSRSLSSKHFYSWPILFYHIQDIHFGIMILNHSNKINTCVS